MDELRALPRDAQAELSAAMGRLKRSEPIRNEVRRVTSEIDEIRVNLGNNPYRLLFARVGQHDQVLLALTALYKNTRRTPANVVQRAEERLKDWNRNQT